MITPDTITADLLAGLQACPRCGFPRNRNYADSTPGKGFQCGTWFFTCKDEKMLPIVSKTCLANEAAILRARVESLTQKLSEARVTIRRQEAALFNYRLW